jgi:hypothetical protein
LQLKCTMSDNSVKIAFPATCNDELRKPVETTIVQPWFYIRVSYRDTMTYPYFRSGAENMR